jgi:hypothetical protein
VERGVSLLCTVGLRELAFNADGRALGGIENYIEVWCLSPDAMSQFLFEPNVLKAARNAERLNQRCQIATPPGIEDIAGQGGRAAK